MLNELFDPPYSSSNDYRVTRRIGYRSSFSYLYPAMVSASGSSWRVMDTSSFFLFHLRRDMSFTCWEWEWGTTECCSCVSAKSRRDFGDSEQTRAELHLVLVNRSLSALDRVLRITASLHPHLHQHGDGHGTHASGDGSDQTALLIAL